MSDQPANATEAELRDQCDHVCLKDSGHVDRGEPHFYGYRLGPHSLTGLRAEVDRLRAAIRRHRDEVLSGEIGEPTEHQGAPVFTHTVRLWEALND